MISPVIEKYLKRGSNEVTKWPAHQSCKVFKTCCYIDPICDWGQSHWQLGQYQFVQFQCFPKSIFMHEKNCIALIWYAPWWKLSLFVYWISWRASIHLYKHQDYYSLLNTDEWKGEITYIPTDIELQLHPNCIGNHGDAVISLCISQPLSIMYSLW